MTSWNAANDFIEARNRASRNASVSNDSSGSFDPARTGDPSPAFGHADLDVGHVGRGGPVGLPTRNPIGFAPSADPDRELPSEPRFHTEISFKRHQPPVSPRAGSGPENGSRVDAGPGSEDLVWRLPAPLPEDRSVEEPSVDVFASSAEDGTSDTTAVTADQPGMPELEMFGDPGDGVDAKVPFYKRELSFRRRKPAAEAVPAPLAEEPVVEEPLIEEPLVDELVLDEPVLEEPLIEEPLMASRCWRSL